MYNSQNDSPIARRLAMKQAEANIARLLASGRFTDTGAKYSAQQAQADSSNAALRLTASIVNGKLDWSK